MATTLTPVLTDTWDADRSWTLASYEDAGGYRNLCRLLTAAHAEDRETPTLTLPERPKPRGYERPPREQATYVPDHCSTLE